MFKNRRQTERGFIPVFIVVIIVVLLGGFAIYDMQKESGENIKNPTTASGQPTLSTSVKNNTPTQKITTTVKTTTNKPIVQKKIVNTETGEDRDEDDN